MERRSRSAIGQIGGVFKGASGVVLGALAVGGITAGITTIIGDFEDMENTIRKATGASGEALDELTDQVRRIAEIVPGANDRIASTVGIIATEFPGLAEDVGNLSLKLAEYERVAGGGESTITGLTQVIKQLGLDVDGIAPFLDGLTVIQQQAAVEGDTLLSGLKRLGPAFSVLGFDAGESAAQIAAFEQRGIAARRSASLFDQFLTKAAAGGVTDLRGSLFETIEAIDTATLDTDKLAIANDAVGSTYGALLIKMVETGAFATSGLVEAYENAEGATSSMAAETITVRERIELLGEKLLTRLQPAIEAIIEAIERLIGWIEPALDWIASFGEQIDGTTGSITDRIEPFITFLQEAWESVQEVFAVVVEEYKKSAPQIEEFLSKLGELGSALLPIFEVVLVNAFKLIGIGLRVMLWTFGNVFDTITAIIEAAEATFTGARDVITAVAEALTAAWNTASNAFREAWNWMKDTVLSVWDTIRSAIESGVNFVIDRINDVIGAVNSASSVVNRFNPFGDIPEIEEISRVVLDGGGIASIGSSPAPGASMGTVNVNVDLQGATLLGDGLDEVVDKSIRDGAERGLGRLSPATVRDNAYLSLY